MTSSDGQTIVGPATPPGEGGVGIIRLSGPGAETILLRLFRPSRPTQRLYSHRLYHGRLHSASGELLDEVLAVVMRAPHSYTCEDVAEIHCHGGPLLLRRILDGCLEAGARLARPGEFTLRAFLNGRLDLSQAEAVIDLIRARSEAASAVALRQMEGHLSRAIRELREPLVDVLAFVEACIDFPEEDLDLPEFARLAATVREVVTRTESLLSSFTGGRVLREGVSVLILGRPNVGKSSLLNALLGEERAIVADQPGTTRDIIEEGLSLGGVPLRLIDTAGVRRTEDPVESEGVRRALAKIDEADLVLLVVDGSRVPGDDDRMALSACREIRLLLVVSKSDLPAAPLPADFAALPQVRVSTHTGEGLAELQSTVAGLFSVAEGVASREAVLLADRRHHEALLRARSALQRFVSGAEASLSPELLALELREALHALGEITGETTPDEILDLIFSRFCIGK